MKLPPIDKEKEKEKLRKIRDSSVGIMVNFCQTMLIRPLTIQKLVIHRLEHISQMPLPQNPGRAHKDPLAKWLTLSNSVNKNSSPSLHHTVFCSPYPGSPWEGLNVTTTSPFNTPTRFCPPSGHGVNRGGPTRISVRSSTS